MDEKNWLSHGVVCFALGNGHDPSRGVSFMVFGYHDKPWSVDTKCMKLTWQVNLARCID